jgi:hypothetical protein
MHELYLWPFQDAVRAGTGSIMCSCKFGLMISWRLVADEKQTTELIILMAAQTRRP